MMQVIRVCDDDGGVGRASRHRVCANKCVNAWSICICGWVCTACRVILCFWHARVDTVYTPLPSQGERGRCCGWFWGQQMYGSTVPEASKLPVIFPMMQRSVHNHRESILLLCSPSASPAHRLTGCHNNLGPAPCLLEQNSGKSTTTTTTLVTTPSRKILTNVQS